MDQYCTKTITNRAFGASRTHLTNPTSPTSLPPKNLKNGVTSKVFVQFG